MTDTSKKADNVNTDEYVKLSDRLAKLEGPCRELDGAILRAHSVAQWEMQDECPPYTSSLDAITQLIKSDFPSPAWFQRSGSDGEADLIRMIDSRDAPSFEAENCATEAIARCVCYVKAMEAKAYEKAALPSP